MWHRVLAVNLTTKGLAAPAVLFTEVTNKARPKHNINFTQSDSILCSDLLVQPILRNQPLKYLCSNATMILYYIPNTEFPKMSQVNLTPAPSIVEINCNPIRSPMRTQRSREVLQQLLVLTWSVVDGSVYAHAPDVKGGRKKLKWCTKNLRKATNYPLLRWAEKCH